MTLTTEPPAPLASRTPAGAGGSQPVQWRRWLLPVLLLAALALGGYELWIGEIRNMLYPRNWGVVVPGRVYRSGQISHHIIRQTLVDNHIGLVLFMSGDDPARTESEVESRTCANLGIRRLNFNLDGNGTGNPSKYVHALEEMIRSERAGIPVLVHCETGAQRTGGMVALYRVLVERRSGREAYEELLRYGHDPHKNPHLLPYLNQNMNAIAQSLAAAKAIDAAPNPLPVIGP